MASTSSSTFPLFKLEITVLKPQRIRKKLRTSTPSGLSIRSSKFLPSHKAARFLPSGSHYTTRCRLDNNIGVIEDPAKDKTPQLEVKTSDHWRKNIPVLGHSHRVFSIDLIGYGYSDKPDPRDFEVNSFYTFETWATQLNEFCVDVVKDKAFFICNSIGGVVGLQAAVMEPEICRGITILNISLRMLHIKKQPWYGRPLIRSFQSLLRNTAVGKFFFKSVATPESVRSILCQCYHDTSQVTEELVQSILLPGLEPGAVDVFLEFICYSGGPLPEELLPQVKCPVLIAWGDKDPWEPIELGRAYGKFDSVEDFIVLPNVGHCPQDEAPDLVNPLVESFVARHARPEPSLSPNRI